MCCRWPLSNLRADLVALLAMMQGCQLRKSIEWAEFASNVYLSISARTGRGDTLLLRAVAATMLARAFHLPALCELANIASKAFAARLW